MECSLSVNKPSQIGEGLSVVQEVHESIEILSLKGLIVSVIELFL